MARSKVKSRSHHDVAHLHTQPMSLPCINFLHLTVSEIQAGQTFSRRVPGHPDTMGENNTPTALKGCGVTETLQGSAAWRKTETRPEKARVVKLVQR